MSEKEQTNMQINITLNGVTYEKNYDNDIKINKDNLDQEFMDQPRKLAEYCWIADHAEARAQQLKHHMKRVELETLGVKFTEVKLKGVVITDDQYVEALNQYLEAQHVAKQLKSCATAIATRRDMLMQLGAGARAFAAPMHMNAYSEASAREVFKNNDNE